MRTGRRPDGLLLQDGAGSDASRHHRGGSDGRPPPTPAPGPSSPALIDGRWSRTIPLGSRVLLRVHLGVVQLPRLTADRGGAQPGRESERIALGRDLRNLEPAAPASADWRLAARPADLNRLRAAADDPRPMITGRAVTALVSARIRHASGAPGGLGAAGVNVSRLQPLWEDTSLVIRYASRLDQPATTRAAVAADVALLLSLAYLARRPGDSTDPASLEVTTIARIAELGFAARRDWLPARSALALARLMQHRPGETRDLLRNDVIAVNDADPVERARAMAVWGLAEFELGDRDRAGRLAAAASRLAPEETLTLGLVHRVSAATNHDGDPVGR